MEAIDASKMKPVEQPKKIKPKTMNQIFIMTKNK